MPKRRAKRSPKFPPGGPCASYKGKASRAACRGRVSAKIKALMGEGKKQPQAVAMALSMETAGRLGAKGGYHRAASETGAGAKRGAGRRRQRGRRAAAT